MSKNSNNILPEPYWNELTSVGKAKQLSAGEYFIMEGEVPRKFALVMSGLFRYVYIDQKGIEYTKGLILEGNFISSYSAMISNTPSYFFIEALEDSKILEISADHWNKLKAKDPFWNQLLITLLERGYTVKEKRERELLLLDAETRYRNFLKEFPNIEDRLTQRIIASYLGIQPESLSRIRKKISP